MADSGSKPFIRYEQRGRIVVMTMDRPDERNAIGDQDICDSFADAVTRAGADPGVSCVILTGAGASFCAGGNLKAMRDKRGVGAAENPAATRQNYRRSVQKVIRGLWELEVPAIAAVNGHAIGLGCDIACMCDIRIAADNAKFASSFINVGLIPGDGGAWVLPRAVGLSRAAELIFTGDMIDAEQAFAYGLVSRVVPAAKLLDEAHALAEKIAGKPPQALRLAKRLLREGQHSRLPDVLELSAAYQALVHEAEDHQEALSAFFEKRPPQYQGR